MDRERLIIVKGVDKTQEIFSAEYDSATQKYDICFLNSPIVYHYAPYSVMILEYPQRIDAESVEITHRGSKLFQMESIQRFCGMSDKEFWHISFKNGSERTYDIRDLDISFSCLAEPRSADVLSYLKELSGVNEIKSPDGKILLEKQYHKLQFVGGETALASYLNPGEHPIKRYKQQTMIFPFGGNANQFQALENALSSQISVIQGPPGTGKTQTILNILANLLIANKTVQVVSGNNSATLNIMEKLASSQYMLDFLVAPLGSSDNKKVFLANQAAYPSFSGWEKSTEEQADLEQNITELSFCLHNIFEKQERMAAARLELESLKTEIRHFQKYCEDRKLSYDSVRYRRAVDSSKLMKLWQECEEYADKDRSISFWFKIKCTYLYGLSTWSYYANDISKIVTMLQFLFYQARLNELKEEIGTLETALSDEDAKGKLDKLTALSMDYLRSVLYERYKGQKTRTQLTDEDFWKHPQHVLDEYPITLSSTFASRSSLRGVVYDYIIMDEASQVDIATGALALSGAKSAVIVGDLKQLPNVVKPKMEKTCDEIFARYDLPEGYSFTQNSFLKSVCTILPDAPQVLLREHYRCHPKIIDFCNQKFYHNELVIMTDDCGETDALAIYQTVAGNHRRDHLNQRQIDVTLTEVLPHFSDVSPEKIGVIAPYREQVTTILQQINVHSGIEVDTVHGFQGREKDAIILTTVDDVITDFSDNPYLLNVAVSRAKKRLALVVSGNEQPEDSNIRDLISYIKYNNFEVIQSKIYSIFDYLYQQYTAARIARLCKYPRVSAYASENLMYGLILEILEQYQELMLDVVCHVPLHCLLRDVEGLSKEETRYAMNHATHVDFLIYRKIGKTPVLAIEVDGFHNHKQGTQQYERDLKKNHILQLYNIPLLRFPTNSCGEREKITEFLDNYKANRIS